MRMVGKERVDARIADVLEGYVRKIQDEKFGWKYGCGAKGCTKLFHGPEFVLKHLRLKHVELVGEEAGKIKQQIYRDNYMR